MKTEIWGTFSVKDHLRRRPFVAEVLLYDRLMIPRPPTPQEERPEPGKENEFSYYRAKTMWEMFAAAAKKAASNDPVKVAKALEGMKTQTPLGEVEMRADNHQLLQPLYVSTLKKNPKYDVEDSGLGWKTDAKVDAKSTALPTTCKMQRPS